MQSMGEYRADVIAFHMQPNTFLCTSAAVYTPIHTVIGANGEKIPRARPLIAPWFNHERQVVFNIRMTRQNKLDVEWEGNVVAIKEFHNGYEPNDSTKIHVFMATVRVCYRRDRIVVRYDDHGEPVFKLAPIFLARSPEFHCRHVSQQTRDNWRLFHWRVDDIRLIPNKDLPVMY